MPRTTERATPRRLGRLALLIVGALALASPALAQSPTPEGTVITNTASASWTDANGNTYTPVTASASVTVGFLAGVDVTSAASVTPASPSTGNEIPFTINNVGNGRDSVTVGVVAGAGVTITGYRLGASPTVLTLAQLNDALDGPNSGFDAGSNIVVHVVYDVAAGRGGQTTPVTLTATSIRTPATSDASTTNVIPPAAVAVAVTPDGGAVDRLPSNGTQYTAAFTVANNGNASETFDLAASLVPGGTVTIVSVNGTAGASSTVTIASGATATVNVIYTVADVAAGTTDDLRLTATAQTDNGVSDQGNIVVTVIKAAIAMTKEAFRDDQTTAIGGSDRVVPGEFIQYRITVTSTGGASATSVSVTDALPGQVAYQSAAGDAAGWTINQAAGTVTASLASLASGSSRYFWVRVRVN
jgi:uncharacterized repeat protein (TIGR01451 family)